MSDRIMMALGDFRFEATGASYKTLTLSRSWRWPEQARIGREPAHQFTGREKNEIKLSGTLYPTFAGGLADLRALRDLGNTGEPQLLVDGLGRTWGSWVILSVNDNRSYLLDDGRPRKIGFDLTLREYGEDDIFDFSGWNPFSALISLTGLFEAGEIMETPPWIPPDPPPSPTTPEPPPETPMESKNIVEADYGTWALLADRVPPLEGSMHHGGAVHGTAFKDHDLYAIYGDAVLSQDWQDRWLEQRGAICPVGYEWFEYPGYVRADFSKLPPNGWSGISKSGHDFYGECVRNHTILGHIKRYAAGLLEDETQSGTPAGTGGRSLDYERVFIDVDVPITATATAESWRAFLEQQESNGVYYIDNPYDSDGSGFYYLLYSDGTTSRD